MEFLSGITVAMWIGITVGVVAVALIIKHRSKSSSSSVGSGGSGGTGDKNNRLH